jgi:hypothetical protein
VKYEYRSDKKGKETLTSIVTEMVQRRFAEK